MSVNKKVMSIAIDPALYDELTKYAKRKGMSKSSYISYLVEQSVKLNIDDEMMVIGRPADEEIVPVVLKVPKILRDFPEKLRQWMDVQTAGVVKAMVKNIPSKTDGVS